MGDILEIYQYLQQQLQRDDLILTDVMTCKCIAIRKLELMKDAPYPGKREEKVVQQEEAEEGLFKEKPDGGSNIFMFFLHGCQAV
jgi:hypothetical protein